MENRVRKQPKWHQLVSSVPSIPPRDKQVPEGDDYEDEQAVNSQYSKPKNSEQNEAMLAYKREQANLARQKKAI